jgi:hypothetical protein
MEVLGAGNKPVLIRRIDQAGGKSACELIYKSLFQRLLLNTMRAYDPVRGGDFHLAVAFEVLAEPDVMAIAKRRDSYPHISAATDLWHQTATDDRTLKLRHYRNKVVAHLSDLDPTMRLPINNDLFVIAGTTTKIAENLSIGTGACTIELRQQTGAYRQSAECFWSVWLTKCRKAEP